MPVLSSVPARTILLVEDDEAMTAALTDLLSSAGYRVAHASTVKRALRAIALLDERCVVLLDPLVPGANAAKLLQSALERGHALVTIAVAVHPAHGGGGGGGQRRPSARRLISPDVLLQIVQETSSESSTTEGLWADAPLPLWLLARAA